MSDNDTTLLTEAYSKMLGEKALTPDQIANNAQAAGTKGDKGEALPKNKTEDKETTKTLEKVPYTDQNGDNFNQDGVDTKVKDRYTLKEDDQANAVAEFYGTKKVLKEDDVQPGAASAPAPTAAKPDLGARADAFRGLYLDTETDFIEALQALDTELAAVGEEHTNMMKNELARMLTNHLVAWKRGTLTKPAVAPVKTEEVVADPNAAVAPSVETVPPQV